MRVIIIIGCIIVGIILGTIYLKAKAKKYVEEFKKDNTYDDWY